MSAETTYYAKIPVVTYEWVEVPAVTEDEVMEKHPQAIEVKHWAEMEDQQ